MSTGPDDETPEVGSVGEEAAKLFGALSDWAREHGPDLEQGLQGFADQAATAAREMSEHVDTGAADCSWCPLCRTARVVRTPEVREHLTAAAASLLQAAAGIIAGARSAPSESQGVEHIDLDGDWPEEER